MLERKQRYLQLAFNYDLTHAISAIGRIPQSDRILIEAGTPFIKREGLRGIERLAHYRPGRVVADYKIADGAAAEVAMSATAGASAVTALGSSSRETLLIFVEECARLGVVSMIDMLGVDEPMRVLRALRRPPDCVIIHKGRDEERTRGKLIQYKHINKIRSKYDVLISAAGGIDLRESRSAIFNGADIVVVNLVKSGAGLTGIDTASDIGTVCRQFLDTIS